MTGANPNQNTAGQRAKQRALALAALTQASILVASIAREGKCERQYFEHSIDALLDHDYLGNRHFSLGISQSKRLLQGHAIKHAKAILNYNAALLTLEKRLAKQPHTLKNIADGMQRIQQQIRYFNNPYHDNIIAAIAHLYGETVSTIEPKIIVRGKPEYLTQSRNTEQIRCLLFSGIRAAWVWRTHGGSAFRLMFGRKALLRNLRQLAGQHP